jgi:hypothetical protein
VNIDVIGDNTGVKIKSKQNEKHEKLVSLQSLFG